MRRMRCLVGRKPSTRLMTIIHFDGQDWPVETFLDAYGFTRMDALDPHQRDKLQDQPGRLMAVLVDGQLIPDRAGTDLPWRDVRAIRSVSQGGLLVCDWCGELCSQLTTLLRGEEVCEDCERGAER